MTTLSFDDLQKMTIGQILTISEKIVSRAGITLAYIKLKDCKITLSIKPPKYDKLPDTEEDRYKIVKELKDQGFTQVELATIFSVTQPTISKILKYKSKTQQNKSN